ncbi:hypothetical protein K3495_g7972 [Podosphaera aphanis]|nr:hypothetical protein K3495_g7972 [Podosphaera aphanis]
MTNVQNLLKESTQANQNMSNSNVDHKTIQLKGKANEFITEQPGTSGGSNSNIKPESSKPANKPDYY